MIEYSTYKDTHDCNFGDSDIPTFISITSCTFLGEIKIKYSGRVPVGLLGMQLNAQELIIDNYQLIEAGTEWLTFREVPNNGYQYILEEVKNPLWKRILTFKKYSTKKKAFRMYESFTLSELWEFVDLISPDFIQLIDKENRK